VSNGWAISCPGSHGQAARGKGCPGIEEGIAEYVQATIALREFRREIQRRSRDVLKRRLPELVRAIGLSGVEADRVGLEEYANPDGLKNWPGNFAWLAIRCRLSDVLEGYFGLLWEEVDGQGLRVGVVANLTPVERELYERIRHSGKGAGIKMLACPSVIETPVRIFDLDGPVR
jgi:hypothetical protein